VLTPSLIGIDEAAPLPNASTLCGRCESVCPVKIPLPKMLRHWREREFAKKLAPRTWRSGLALWSWVARRPALYHAFTEAASRALGWAGGRRGRFRSLPLAAGWTGVRDMPAPEGRSFHSLWAEREKSSRR
jgi:L-lactate dehydrogenase complex protein LldF